MNLGFCLPVNKSEKRCRTLELSPSQFPPLPERVLAQRWGLPGCRARLIADLAGLGARHD